MSKDVIQINKNKIIDIIQKALGKSSKSGKPIVNEAVIRFDKQDVKYGEMIGMASANIGWYGADFFDDYQINKATDINFKEEHLNKVKFIRSESVILEMDKSKVTFLSPKGTEKYPVKHKHRVYVEDDTTLEQIHRDVMPIDITQEKRTVQFIDLKTVFERSQLTTEEAIEKRKKELEKEDEKFIDEDDGYFEVYAYVRLPKKELCDLPASDSIIFKKVKHIQEKKKSVSAIQLRTLVKLEQKEGYKRILSDIDFLKWHDPLSFEVRVTRAHFDKALSHLDDPVCLEFTQDYLMLSNIGDNYWFAYLIGYSEIESETALVDDETKDTDEAIAEVKSKVNEEEE